MNLILDFDISMTELILSEAERGTIQPVIKKQVSVLISYIYQLVFCGIVILDN